MGGRYRLCASATTAKTFRVDGEGPAPTVGVEGSVTRDRNARDKGNSAAERFVSSSEVQTVAGSILARQLIKAVQSYRERRSTCKRMYDDAGIFDLCREDP